MKKIIGILRPFDLVKTLYVYENGNKIDGVSNIYIKQDGTAYFTIQAKGANNINLDITRNNAKGWHIYGVTKDLGCRYSKPNEFLRNDGAWVYILKVHSCTTEGSTKLKMAADVLFPMDGKVTINIGGTGENAQLETAETIVFDKTPPTLEILSPNDHDTSKKQHTVNVNLTDAVSGFDKWN